MDRATAIGKIKKCLALASSSNAHEAAAALRQAQKLMQEHGITDSDVSMADVVEKGVKSPSNTISMWQSKLARCVAEAFGCELFYCRHAKIGASFKVVRSTDVVFIGVGAAPEVAGYAFEVLLRQAIRDRAAHIAAQPKRLKQSTKTARGDAFATAWVHAVWVQLEKFAGTARDVELIEQYMQQQHPDMRELKPTTRHVSRHVRDDSYASGHKAGQNARLDRAVTGSHETKLIGS